MKQSIFIFLCIMLVACVKRAPAPVNEAQSEAHEDWGRIELWFREGHLHGSSLHTETDAAGVQYFKATQKLIFEKNTSGDVVLQGNTPLRLLANNHYALEIIYYDVQGKRINQAFASAKDAPFHQHYFIIQNAKDTAGKALTSTEDVWNYVYRDTDPESAYLKKGGRLRRRNWDGKNPQALDPIGLKGYFHIKKAYVTFDLRIFLAHFTALNKLNQTTGQLFPYNRRPEVFYASSDVDITLPVYIYSDKSFDTNKIYKDAARAFGVSEEAIKTDYTKKLNADTERGGLYF